MINGPTGTVTPSYGIYLKFKHNMREPKYECHVLKALSGETDLSEIGIKDPKLSDGSGTDRIPDPTPSLGFATLDTSNAT
jgi:hypothetical protein